MSSPLNRQFSLLLAATVAAACTAGCAQAAPFNPDNLPSSEADGVQDACRSIMRLEPGEAHEVGCFQSLSRSLSVTHATRNLGLAREACRARGLTPSTGDFAVCVLQGRAEAPDAPAQIAAVRDIAVPGGRRSFTYASNADRHAREELACAALGLDPTGGAFGGCVASLAATMFELDNPPS